MSQKTQNNDYAAKIIIISKPAKFIPKNNYQTNFNCIFIPYYILFPC